MEPVCFNTGNDEEEQESVLPELASMEPVCFNTGNVVIQPVTLAVKPASMEPVCFNTGNHVRNKLESQHMMRFNGAGVFQHRKLCFQS